MRSTLLIVVLALVAGGLGLLAGRAFDRSGSPPSTEVARIGDPAPAIALPDLDGRVRHLSEWQGRPLLINFWASWCTPCIEEMPLLDGFAADQGNNGVQLLGIALDEAEAVRSFLTRVPVRYPTLIEAAGRTDSSVKLGNTRAVLPFSALIDADGRVKRLRVGSFRDADDLRRWATSD
jgi:thiol-disulfide isomerase/thioredoxin